MSNTQVNSNAGFAAGERDALLAKIAALEKAAEEAKAAKASKIPEITFHISDKTGVFVVRGLGRYPFSGYYTQVTRLAKRWNDFMAFVEKYKHLVPQSKEETFDKTKLVGLPAGVVITPAEKPAS